MCLGFVAKSPTPLSMQPILSWIRSKTVGLDLSLASSLSNASRRTADFEVRRLTLTASSAASISGGSFSVTVFMMLNYTDYNKQYRELLSNFETLLQDSQSPLTMLL